MLNFGGFADRQTAMKKYFACQYLDANLAARPVARCFGETVACKGCGSEKQQYFSGELSVAFLTVEKVKQAPVYVVQKILVCLDCGFTGLVLPKMELEHLKEGM
jgi:hypothetical protein